MTAQSYQERFKQAILPVLCLVFTYLVFQPLDLVMTNQTYLDFAPKDFALQFIAIALAIGISVTAVMSLFKGKVFRFFLCGICGLILATYVQALFLNNNLGTLDGTEIAWSEMKTDMLINGIIWLILILSQYVLSHFVKESYKTVAFVLALAVFGSQLISCVTLASGLEDTQKGVYIIHGQGQYSVSSNQNIIVFSLDTFSKNTMDEILVKYPQTYEEFKDFTYYDNTSGDYAKTFPALAGLLTGHSYDATEKSIDYYHNAWTGDTANAYYGKLHDEGYNVGVYSTVNYIAAHSENLKGKIDNLKYSDGVEFNMPLLKGIVKLSLFRCSPLSLKMHFWLTTDDLNNRTEYKTDMPVEPLRYNVEFYNELQRCGLTLTDEKVYSWTHLWGGHEPYQTNEFMQEVESSDSLTQARGYLFAVSQYIEEMKKIGAYDNSLIIVTTDHGDKNNPFVTLMIKYPNEEFDTMQINSAPVMHADIMPTISYYICGECIGTGRNIRDIGEDEQRERYYRRMCYDPDY